MLDKIRNEMIARQSGGTTRFQDEVVSVKAIDLDAVADINRRRDCPLSIKSGGVLIARAWTADEAVASYKAAKEAGFGALKIKDKMGETIDPDDRSELEDSIFGEPPADRDYTVEIDKSDWTLLNHHFTG